ncbi:putative head morphogenesis protein [Rhizobium phage vB_RglS_P106B]|uniref:Putative head morphogenesis protein n=1 Tax=Rhizobium phage vB_RglS_P106B TaxID=1458697 RepID=W6EC05_9CAUD|nr:head morphogenesis [Rhizobium phage vB_RglS_P106B]AHJ10702.1 putative head morphogenesis protein [Rhizobium phage vB_RglS_P106B]
MALRPGSTARQTLDYLIDLFEPRIRDAFLAAIQNVTDDAIIIDMITAIENGDPERAFQALGFSPAAMRPLTEAIEQAFEQGGILTGDNFPEYLNTPSGRTVFRFDVRNARSEAWLRDHSSQLITRLTDEARENVQSVLQRGMIDGRNPRSVALDIVGRIDPTTKQRTGGIVGLTRNQELWVANTRRDLVNLDERYFTRELRDKRFDRIVARAIADERRLPADTIDKIVTAYKNNALRYRGESIGRTEAIQSLNRSEWEAHMQAVDMGALRKGDVSRHWDSAGDSRVRWSHKRMDALYNEKGVGLDEPFVSPSGAIMMYPGDTSLGAPADEVIMCRCRVRLKADFLAQWTD